MGVARTVLLATCLVLSALQQAEAVPKSRFVKDIDERKLDEEWKDEDEDDDWHEDTFEWKQKMAKKKAGPGIDLNMLQKGGANIQEKVLEQEASSGNMQMAFATLKKGVAATQREAEEVGKRWQALMQTAGISTNLYAISADDLLFTDDNGVILKVREFVLDQPEIEKFRWKDTDFDREWLVKRKAEIAKQEADEKARLLKSAQKAKKEAEKSKGKKGGKGKKSKTKKATTATTEEKKTKKSTKKAAAAATPAPASMQKVAAAPARPAPPKKDL